MTVLDLYEMVVRPTLQRMGDPFLSDRAAVGLLAIAFQETSLEDRVQIGGPARGLWQFEEHGGVAGVLTHKATRSMAAIWCRVLLYNPDRSTVYDALRDNDVLACIFARLLLFTDPQVLPSPADSVAWWSYYLRCWRPGKPHQPKWARSLSLARDAVFGKE